MKNLILLLICIFSQNVISAQDNFILTKHNKNISFIRIDSLQQSHTTVVEYKDFLVLCELPLQSQSGKKDSNIENQNGERLQDYLKQEYGKPIKYIISSHWHKHSLSGLIPFLRKGAKIISTSYNWDKAMQKGILSKVDSSQYDSQIIKVNTDSLILKDTGYPIKLVIMDSTYQNKPTDNYMMPYFVKDKTLFVSCMGAIKDINYDKVKVFTYSSRLLDIARLIEEKKLSVTHIIRLAFSKQCLPQGCPYVFSYKSILQMLKQGESADETIQRMEHIDLETLKLKQDSILQNAISKQMPSYVFRNTAYNCLKKKEYEKAIIYAKLLNLYYPGIASYINTLGECYYQKGDIETAKFYHLAVRKLTKKYGMEAWKKNMKKSK